MRGAPFAVTRDRVLNPLRVTRALVRQADRFLFGNEVYLCGAPRRASASSARPGVSPRVQTFTS
jgi:hypothetical protein